MNTFPSEYVCSLNKYNLPAITDPFIPDVGYTGCSGERPVPTTGFSLAVPDSHQIPDQTEIFLSAEIIKPLFSYK